MQAQATRPDQQQVLDCAYYRQHLLLTGLLGCYDCDQKSAVDSDASSSRSGVHHVSQVCAYMRWRRCNSSLRGMIIRNLLPTDNFSESKYLQRRVLSCRLTRGRRLLDFCRGGSSALWTLVLELVCVGRLAKERQWIQDHDRQAGLYRGGGQTHGLFGMCQYAYML